MIQTTIDAFMYGAAIAAVFVAVVTGFAIVVIACVVVVFLVAYVGGAIEWKTRNWRVRRWLRTL